ncbi:MAG TPA: response regulator, partial [Myxococcota bacterium]
MSLTPAPADESPSTVRRPLKVLVVDDNVDAAEALADVITLWGHDAQTAFDGASGLAALNASTFDVVIVDITLPDFDGYELARRFRAAAPSTTMLGSA